MNRWRIALLSLGTYCMAVAPSALAAVPHSEGFESPTWTAGQTGNWQNYDGGDIERVTTGTNGVASADGSAHAIITNLSENNDVFDDPSLGALSPYTFLGGASSNFNDGFTVSQDIYLDTTWSEGSGFDLSAAVYNQSGTHLRDFVWHVGKTANGLQANASNNTDRSFNDYKIANAPTGVSPYTVGSTGWYTFQIDFTDDGSGQLQANFSILDDSDSGLWSGSITTGDDVDTQVGGNGYFWFTYNNIDGLAIDNTSLVPEPASLALLGLGSLLMTRRRRN